MADGRRVYVYSLTNRNGMQARITNYGGIVVSLRVPDRKGAFDDIVLGYDSLSEYVSHNNPYFGALIGRYGNRIAKGRFTLNGKTYTLECNDGANHLHGGFKGFDKVVWDERERATDSMPSLELKYYSINGEDGYPGNLSVQVTYTLTNANELQIDYSAQTDMPTVVNLTHHSYFNLAGAGKGDILGEVLKINADRYTPVEKSLIPTGKLANVRGTPMDFTTPTAIGARITSDDEQLRYAGGYDHNFVLTRSGLGLELAARVYDKTTGRVMEVWTTEPGLQFYSGNFLDGSNIGKGRISYKHRFGFCLETQHFPDSPNEPSFPSTVLNPGDTLSSRTVYRFSVQ